jgi:hypothetical protein
MKTSGKYLWWMLLSKIHVKHATHHILSKRRYFPCRFFLSQWLLMRVLFAVLSSPKGAWWWYVKVHLLPRLLWQPMFQRRQLWWTVLSKSLPLPGVILLFELRRVFVPRVCDGYTKYRTRPMRQQNYSFQQLHSDSCLCVRHSCDGRWVSTESVKRWTHQRSINRELRDVSQILDLVAQMVFYCTVVGTQLVSQSLNS